MTTLVNDGKTDDGIRGSTVSHEKNGISGSNADTTPRNTLTPEGNGVFGVTQVPDGAGVFGLHNNGGVGVAGFGHPAGIGVAGISAPAEAKGGDGVLGISNSELRNGIVGRNDSITARSSIGPGGNGVLGFTRVPDGAGVSGVHATTGVGVSGLGLIGVSGGSVNGVGVMGVSAPPGGKGGDGVQGITNSEQRNGVYGRNDSTTARDNNDPLGNGVLGVSQVPDGAGVMGVSNGYNGSGVYGIGTGGMGHGVFGKGDVGVVGYGGETGTGVWGISTTWFAGYFSGNVRVEGHSEFYGNVQVQQPFTFSVDGDAVLGSAKVKGSLNVEGDISVAGDIFLVNRDMAERFELVSGADCTPGMVMIMCADNVISPCTHAYDRRAVGVISGAGTLRTAIMLGAQTSNNIPSAAIALVGTVYCLVDANYAAVEVGDLLTCSNTQGHAMKATDVSLSFGSIIGKALAPMQRGCGLIPIIVALQ